MQLKLFFISLLLFLNNYIFAQSNIGFENGNYTSWQAYIGTNDSGFTRADSSSFWLSSFQLTNGNGIDSFSKLPIVCPSGGNYSIKLGSPDSIPSTRLQMVSIDIPLNKPNKVLCVYYQVISQIAQEPKPPYVSFDLSYHFLSNPNYVNHIVTANLYQEPLCCLGYPTHIPITIDSIKNIYFTSHWECKSFGLNSSPGTILSIKLFSSHCSGGGHWAYCYFDIEIKDYDIKIKCDTGNRVKLTAPEGYSYSWYKNYQTMHLNDSIISIPIDSIHERYTCIVTSRLICIPSLYPIYDSIIFQLPVDFNDKIKANLSTQKICRGDSVFVFSTGAMHSIAWSNSIKDSSYFKTTTDSTLIVTGKNNYNCFSSDTISINVNPIPIVGAYAVPNDSICINDTIMLKGTGAKHYSWSDGIIDSSLLLVNATHTFFVVGIDSNNCRSNSQITIFVDSCKSVTSSSFLSFDKKEINIYPNPAQLSIAINQHLIGTSIEVIDLLGRIYISNFNQKSKIINVEALPNGIYFIKATDTNGNSKVAKFVKQ